ncbi:Gfo/Idh/MocA family oxidoreductase [Luteococcus peritonei]|uniref:Gfo/Idh/MocA family protein n=1 Tax=Luteococcus peritonei TaxID=88874 RepID=A0ABW4RUT7_9ACTN
MSMGIGVIGAGDISSAYLEHLTRCPDVTVLMVGNRTLDKARGAAEKFGVPRWGSVEEVLAAEDVELVVNLTIPAVHAQVTRAALEAGKHVWSEKPLATSLEESAELVRLAADRGLRLGCAPDTMLGPVLQQGLRAFAEHGGSPLRGRADFGYRGPDAWHPNPAFLFADGAGPVLDVGPYYVTALVLALGSVTRVRALGQTPRSERVVAQGPKAGERFPVQVPTTVDALLEHEGGAQSTASFSFDQPFARTQVEFAGTEAAVMGIDPNQEGGSWQLARPDQEPEQHELDAGDFGRGTGVVDMVRSLRDGVPHRMSGELAHHVLEVMLAIESAARSGEAVEPASRAPRVELLPEGWDPTR